MAVARRVTKQERDSSAQMEKGTDPDAYTEEQLQWYRLVCLKDVKFYVGYTLAFTVFALTRTPCPVDLSGKDGLLLSAQSRAACTCLFALVAVITLGIDILYSTAPEMADRKWHLLLDWRGSNFASSLSKDGWTWFGPGHFSYLTVHILTTQAIYFSMAALTEIACLFSDSQVIRKAVTATNQFAVFNSSLGTLLTILFLKFNWFEPSWRRGTLEMYLARGKTSFQRKVLFTHLNQICIALLDLLVVKRNHKLLSWATPSLSNLFAVSFVYVLSYIMFTHYNYHHNGGYYPYPFMDKMLSSWGTEISFILGLSAFCFFIVFLYYLMATTSLLEELLR